MVFLNFFAIFLEFLLPVVKERNETIIFIFSLSRAFPTYLGLELGHNGVFNFLNFFAIFLEFSITRRVGAEQNEMKILFSLFLCVFQPILA